MNIHETKQLLYASGCSLPIDVEDSDVISCYTFVDQLSSLVEGFVNNLRKYLYVLDKSAFVEEINDVRQLLLQCYRPTLVSDCDYLIDLIKKEKYTICEALSERFCASLTSFAVAYQTNKYRLSHGDSSSSLEVLSVKVMDSPKTKPLILAVDDSPEILKILQDILGKKYEFLAVNSGVSALKLLRQKQPDVFIFDIEMPLMDGFELAQRANIKSSGKPLIFLTSNANSENLLAALNVGALDFLVKPCDEKTILDKIDGLFGV